MLKDNIINIKPKENIIKFLNNKLLIRIKKMIIIIKLLLILIFLLYKYLNLNIAIINHYLYN